MNNMMLAGHVDGILEGNTWNAWKSRESESGRY